METLATKLQTADQRIAEWTAQPCTCPKARRGAPQGRPCQRCTMVAGWQRTAARLETEALEAVAYLAQRQQVANVA
jgi:hypothetical protein